MTRVSLFNAAPDTGNLGVSALGYSVIAGLARRISDLSLLVADSGFGIRGDSISVDGRPFSYRRCGVRSSLRLYRPESMWNIRLAAKFGGAWNQIASELLSQDFILDITGGDSFTDLYGLKRFRSCTENKLFFLERGIPLGLLPQTYGPFQDPSRRAIAAKIVQEARFAWARDLRSYQVLRELAGSKFDHEHYRPGVDVAFLLEAIQPSEAGIGEVAMKWLTNKTTRVVGLNVSGLIYNDPVAAVSQYGFVADYRMVVTDLVRRLLEQSDARILLVPHVVTDSSNVESDIVACRDVAKVFHGKYDGRLAVLPALYDPRQIKWVISNCDWFCGTRMHATIAALSTGVPTAAVAYSLKTAGVFESCGQGRHVIDPRELPTKETVDQLWNSWLSRHDARESLSVELPAVLDQANRQMDLIAAACKGQTSIVPTGAILT